MESQPSRSRNNMQDKSVSVIIPIYNSADTLAEAIDSVLSQSHRSIECIVVNDGSTDETRQVIQQYLDNGKRFDLRVKYIPQEHLGKAAAINTALTVARGNFIAILDADDTLTPDSIKDRLAIFWEHPYIMTVYADANNMDKNGKIYGIKKSRPVRKKEELVNFVTNPVASCSIMTRIEVFKQIGRFDTAFFMDDVERNMQLYLAGEMFYLPKAVFNFRTYRKKNLSKIRLRYLIDFYKIIDKYFSGLQKYKLIALQTFYQLIKLVYGLFTWKK